MDGNRSLLPLTFLAFSFMLIITARYQGWKVYLLQPTAYNYKMLKELFFQRGYKFNLPYPLPNKPLLVLVPKEKLEAFHKFMMKNDILMETVVHDLQSFNLVLRNADFRKFTYKGYLLQKFDPFFHTFLNDTYASVLEFLAEKRYLDEQHWPQPSAVTTYFTTPSTTVHHTGYSTEAENLTTTWTTLSTRAGNLTTPWTTQSTKAENLTTPSTTQSTKDGNHTTTSTTQSTKDGNHTTTWTTQSTKTVNLTTPSTTEQQWTTQSTTTVKRTTRSRFG